MSAARRLRCAVLGEGPAIAERRSIDLRERAEADLKAIRDDVAFGTLLAWRHGG
jgi:hypothetical protein